MEHKEQNAFEELYKRLGAVVRYLTEQARPDLEEPVACARNVVYELAQIEWHEYSSPRGFKLPVYDDMEEALRRSYEIVDEGTNDGEL